MAPKKNNTGAQNVSKKTPTTKTKNETAKIPAHHDKTGSGINKTKKAPSSAAGGRGKKKADSVIAPSRSTRSMSKAPSTAPSAPATTTTVAPVTNKRKRKAPFPDPDTPLPSIETAPSPPAKRAKTNEVGSEHNSIKIQDFDIAYHRAGLPAYPTQAESTLTLTRASKVDSWFRYEYNKRRPKKLNRKPFFARGYVPITIDTPPIPPPQEPESGKGWKYTSDEGITGDTGAVDSANILPSSRRTRTAAPKAAQIPPPPPKKARKPRKQKTPPPPEPEPEPEEDVPHPPILDRLPPPYPGEERDEEEPSGIDDPDGLYAPSVLYTIKWEGKEYREFRRETPDGKGEEVYWILVVRG